MDTVQTTNGLDSATARRLSAIRVASRLATIARDARGLAKTPCRTTRPTLRLPALSMAEVVGVTPANETETDGMCPDCGSEDPNRCVCVATVEDLEDMAAEHEAEGRAFGGGWWS